MVDSEVEGFAGNTFPLRQQGNGQESKAMGGDHGLWTRMCTGQLLFCTFAKILSGVSECVCVGRGTSSGHNLGQDCKTGIKESSFSHSYNGPARLANINNASPPISLTSSCFKQQIGERFSAV